MKTKEVDKKIVDTRVDDIGDKSIEQAIFSSSNEELEEIKRYRLEDGLMED